MNGASVKLAWTLADQPAYSDGGQPITEYDVLILHGDGTTYSGAPTHCSPSPQTLSQRFCEIPMDVLTATAGSYRLTLGQLIKAKVAPKNSIGYGPYSSPNTDGVRAQTAPLRPASAPTRDAASGRTALVVDYPFPVSTVPPLAYEDGGSSILSLNL
jgi:hypothetical protein